MTNDYRHTNNNTLRNSEHINRFHPILHIYSMFACSVQRHVNTIRHYLICHLKLCSSVIRNIRGVLQITHIVMSDCMFSNNL